jgi:two-component system, OmpR family, phosphate regulon sensor histidine kinase PhoR
MTDGVATNTVFLPQILVVDDEARIREGCRMVLSDLGFEVATASDGAQGLRMIEERHFDIILLDLMMPVISGFDVLTRVRDLHPDTVVIVITGYATIEHSIEAMKKGAFDFIPKPFDPEQLRAVVAKAIKYTSALQDIADSRSRLRMVVNRLTDGVMTTDDHKRIVLANPAFLHMIGYHGENIIGRNVSECITDMTLSRMIDDALSMPLDTYVEITRELVWEGPDERILSARCTPFRGRTGQNLGTITVLHDITALKKIDQMKSDFVSMVSHEIRSPMNSLLMQLKIILDGLAGSVTDKQREILERASGKILNLTNLVSELLDLARIESGLISHEKESMVMSDLLADQVRFHGAAAKEKNIGISFESIPDLPAILANRQGMDEVFTNLITNAIKYSPGGGNITISAGVENEYLFVKVSDTGFGIPAEDRDRIFTRFYRVKDKHTREIHGTGLGLAIVKSIIEAHHGNIRVESEEGHGTAFTVFLPLSESHQSD